MTTPDPPAWPSSNDELVPVSERAKAIFEHKLDDVAAALQAKRDDKFARKTATRSSGTAIEQVEHDAHLKWATVNREADITNLHSFYDSLVALSVGAVDRARAGAELVQKAAAAIATLYTGILALAFSVSDNPLPARGVLAPLFLGLAVVLSTAYIAYLGPRSGYSPGPTPELGLEPKVFQRLNAVTAVASKVTTRRSWSLRASVIALGVGLAYISLPFLSLGGTPDNSSATSETTAWPLPTNGVPDALNAILYKAQVDEVAAQREAAGAGNTPADDTGVLIGLGLFGLAAVTLIPLVWRDERNHAPSGAEAPADRAT